MSVLEYIFHQQCYYPQFGPIGGDTPMGCGPSKDQPILFRQEYEKRSNFAGKLDIALFNKAVSSKHAWDSFDEDQTTEEAGNGELKSSFNLSNSHVSIVDLQNELQELKIIKEQSSRKTSECQTESAEGVDFDWDLTDKTDNETQTVSTTRNGTRINEPLDAIVQTDQRIVFTGHLKSGARREEETTASSNSSRRVTFSITDTQVVSSASQTTWDTQDIGIQVLPSDLDEGEEWPTWRRVQPNAVSKTTQVKDSAFQVDFSPGRAMAADGKLKSSSTISRKSSIGPAITPTGPITSGSLYKSLRLDDDLNDSIHVESSKVRWSSSIKKVVESEKQQPSGKREIGIQTETEVSVAYRNGYGILPPQLPKAQLLDSDPLFFLPVDDHVKSEVSTRWYKSIKKLVKHLLEIIPTKPEYEQRRDLVAVRAIYTWVVENVRYDPAFMEHQLTTVDILRYKAGVCREFTKIFADLCEVADIRVQKIVGFTKRLSPKPGDVMSPGDRLHAWNTVYIEGEWRIVDTTFGAGTYNEVTGEYSASPNHFYFLIDPWDFIYSHFPYDEADSDYCAWQLLPRPLSLTEFNSLPFLSAEFFQMNLTLMTPVSIPFTVEDSATIRIMANQVIRYKFKFYSASEKESESHNHYCLSELDSETRQIANFTVSPPVVGMYTLRIFGKPESQILRDPAPRLDHIASFLFRAIKVIPKVDPWPANSITWGLTSDFFKLGVSLVIGDPNNWDGSKIIIYQGGKVMFKFIHREGPVMVSCHLYDFKGCELLQEIDKNSGKGVLYMMSRKNPLPREELRMKERTGELKPFVVCKVTKVNSVFTIFSLPNTGFYKLEIFAAKKPDKRTRVSMPIVATFIVEARVKTNTAFAAKSLETEKSVDSESMEITPGTTNLDIVLPILDENRNDSIVPGSGLSTTRMFSLSRKALTQTPDSAGNEMTSGSIIPESVSSEDEIDMSEML